MDTCKLMKLILLYLFPFVYSLRLIRGEVVHITVLTVGYTNIENTASHLLCYRSDAGVPFFIGRSAPITTSLDPPGGARYADYVWRVIFPDSDYWGTNGFGPFYCESSMEGRDVTRITTFFQRSDAKFIPSDGMFTKTVNVGDTNVMISMTIQIQSSNEINWRKDGGDKLDMYSGQNPIIFTNPIQISDAGIYEIYYDTERNDNRGGLYKLIVRECPAGKWGPPECYGICDKCYNGGVCDDKSGLCICPPNFKGPNCLEICRSGGGNRFGLNCEFKCTYKPGDGRNACRGILFCLPDPYGCSCDVGATGHACTTACSSGTYGPSCSQTCHCASISSCDIYTGGCPGGCETGWYGVNCQKCEGGTFGEDCLQQCHCVAEACETERGLCKEQCLDDWIEPDCQTRISRLVSVKVNPYQPSSFTCYVEGNPVPSETSVNLYLYAGSTYNTTGISRRSSSVSGSERAVVFDVDSVYQEDYVCHVSVGNGNSLTITSTSYVLPVIGEAPVILSTTSTTVRLQWTAWSEGDDIGDPPLVGYDVLVKKGSDWVTDQRVDQPFISATVRNLNLDTEHRFRVAAVREGLGGTGPPSPDVRTTTLCRKPSDSPSGLQVSANNPKELQVNWEPLPPESAACRSGVISYTIYYTPAGSSTPNSVIVYDDISSYNLTGLDIYLEYTIQMTASNKDEESDRSSEIVHKTLEEVAPAPINVEIPRSTTSSFTVSWSTPLPSNINGNIQKYIIRYEQTAPIVADDYKMEEVLLDVFEAEHTVTDLPAERNYTVQVQTVNGVGSSDWSEPVNAKTVLSGDGRTAIPVGAVVGGVMVPLIIVLLLVLALFFYRRIKQKQPKAESPSSAPNCVPKTSPKYENAVFDDSKTDPHTYQDLTTDTPNYQNLSDPHTYQDLMKPDMTVTYQNVTNSGQVDTYEEIRK